jgi:hypothetical protein
VRAEKLEEEEVIYKKKVWAYTRSAKGAVKSE